MALKILQLHKRDSYEYKNIQDKFAYSSDSDCYAIADGTTQSFRSELWAEAITENFIKHPSFDSEELIRRFTGCAQEFRRHQFEFSTNPAKASLEKEKLKRGATATFLGVKLEADNKLSIITVGDSNIFIVRGGQLEAYPFKTAEELDTNTCFLNTEKLLSSEVSPSNFRTMSIVVQKDDLIVLATDALSRLILKKPDTLTDLAGIQDFESFNNLCSNFWKSKQLEEDDITALLIQNTGSESIQKIVPPEGFSFPREAENEFIPSGILSSTNHINNQEMQQLVFALNQVKEEVAEVKNKFNSQSKLLKMAVGMAAINILLLFYLNVIKDSQDTHILDTGLNEEITRKDKLIKRQQEQIDNLQMQVSILQTTAGHSNSNEASGTDNIHTEVKNDSKPTNEAQIKKSKTLMSSLRDIGTWTLKLFN